MAQNTNTKEENRTPQPKKGRDWKTIFYVIRNTIALTILSTGFIGFIVQNLQAMTNNKLSYVVAAGSTGLVIFFGLKK